MSAVGIPAQPCGIKPTSTMPYLDAAKIRVAINSESVAKESCRGGDGPSPHHVQTRGFFFSL